MTKPFDISGVKISIEAEPEQCRMLSRLIIDMIQSHSDGSVGVISNAKHRQIDSDVTLKGGVIEVNSLFVVHLLSKLLEKDQSTYTPDNAKLP